MAVGNKFYLSNKKDGAVVFHEPGTLSLLLIIIPPIFYAGFTMPLFSGFYGRQISIREDTYIDLAIVRGLGS